jgi:hypothetical protein
MSAENKFRFNFQAINSIYQIDACKHKYLSRLVLQGRHKGEEARWRMTLESALQCGVSRRAHQVGVWVAGGWRLESEKRQQQAN